MIILIDTIISLYVGRFNFIFCTCNIKCSNVVVPFYIMSFIMLKRTQGKSHTH